MRLLGGVLSLTLLTGCTTALDREGRCLAGMIPEVLRAEEEVRSLEESWRTLLRARQQEQLPLHSPAVHVSPAAHRSLSFSVAGQHASPPRDILSSLTAEQDVHLRLVEARSRRHETFSWYNRIVHRFRTRVEEDEMLSQARTALMTWPGILFYPIVRWNIRSVIWDGIDPDIDTDPVTRFCAGRLLALEAASLPSD